MLALFVLSIICLAVMFLINFITALDTARSPGGLFTGIIICIILYGLPIVTMSMFFAKT